MDLAEMRAALARAGIALTDDDLEALWPHVNPYLVKLRALLAVDVDEDEPATGFLSDRLDRR